MEGTIIDKDCFRQQTIIELARSLVRCQGGDDGMGGALTGRITDDIVLAIDAAEEKACRELEGVLQNETAGMGLASALHEAAGLGTRQGAECGEPC